MIMDIELLPTSYFTSIFRSLSTSKNKVFKLYGSEHQYVIYKDDTFIAIRKVKGYVSVRRCKRLSTMDIEHNSNIEI